MSAALSWSESRTWTAADLEELPTDVDWRRFEIVDGTLVVSPHAGRAHEFAVAELLVALHAAAPSSCRVIGSTMIDLHPSYRIPDVTVLTTEAFDSAEVAARAAGVLLAVEIESPSSITTDRITKPAQYAAGGVENFWRVETDPLRLHAYQLREGTYVHIGSWGASEIARLDHPFAVEIDVGALQTR